jgi:flagellin
MSVVINSNQAATLAAANLNASSGLLQRSLARLSTGSRIVNPADDAGGLAVAMKLGATTRRQSAANNNIANSVSYLQTQDGALSTAAKILQRVGELRTLYSDPTKSASDLSNYNVEFTELKSQLTALGSEQFNGISLFGTGALTVGVTGDASGSSVGFGGVDLLGTAAAPQFAPLSDNFATLANWTNNSFAGGSAGVSANTLQLNSGTGGFGRVDTTQTFTGPFEVTMDVRFTGAGGIFQTMLSGQPLVSYVAADTSYHSMRVTYDGAGNSAAYIDGSATPYSTANNIFGSSGLVGLLHFGGLNGAEVQNFSIVSTASGNNVSSISSAGSLGSFTQAGLSAALQDVATYRSTNGAKQSHLGFASELLTVNQANLGAAASRITDVDVAEESTTLARYNILVQSGAAMLAQANQASRSALSLLT